MLTWYFDTNLIIRELNEILLVILPLLLTIHTKGATSIDAAPTVNKNKKRKG